MPVVAAVSLDKLVSASTVSGWDIALAAIVLVVFWVFARLAGRAVRTLVGRLEGVSDDLRSLAVRVARYFFLLLGVGVALSILGAPIEPLLTAAVIVAVVAVLAVRGIADNFAAGVVIQTRRPIHVGDEVESLGFVGTVEELSSRAVVIRTEDGRTVHLPNSKVLDSPIVNRSTAGHRRSEVEVRVRSVPARRRARAGTSSTRPGPSPGWSPTRRPPSDWSASTPTGRRAGPLLARTHAVTAGAGVAAVVATEPQLLRDRALEATVVAPVPAAPAAPSAPL